MQILVFSSLNYDKTYYVKHFVRPEETLLADGYACFCGGKGFNLANAMARAGQKLSFAGAVGFDGEDLLQKLGEQGVDTTYLKKSSSISGHALIQVDEKGQNCIIVVGGANQEITPDYIDWVLSNFHEGDLIVLHNEISNVDYIINQAHNRKISVAFNPSPISPELDACNFSYVDFLFINEVEGSELTGCTAPEDMLNKLHRAYPNQHIVLTLGDAGSMSVSADGEIVKCGIYETEVVDSTAAGDTFMGYFMAEYLRSHDQKAALELASVASGISVSRKGASPSIPYLNEVLSAVSITG